MATEQTGKVIGAMSNDMLIKVLKPTGTGENSEVFSATILALKNAILGYAVFEAVLTQEDTDAPTFEIRENTTGITWTAAYTDVGDYDLVPNVAPPDDTKVLVYFGAGLSSNTKMRWRSGSVKIETSDEDFAPLNDALSNTPIQIRIYS